VNVLTTLVLFEAQKVLKTLRLAESGANSCVSQMKFKVIGICSFVMGIWNGKEFVLIVIVFEY
jgi:hypothetical protein